MKKLFVAAIAAAAFLSAPALAAPPAAPMFNWSGFYVGGNMGVHAFDTKGFYYNLPGNFWKTDRADQAVGGFHAGLQYQFANWVVGVEGGWGRPLDEGFSSAPGGGPGAACSVVVTINECRARIESSWYVGPKLGFAMSNWMVYGTGGFASAKIDTVAIFLPTNFTFFPTSKVHNGWFVGGGLDYMLSNQFILGVDYKHYNYDAANNDVSPGQINNQRLSGKADAVTARLTFKFGN